MDDSMRWQLQPLVIPILSSVIILTLIHYWMTSRHAFKLGMEMPGPAPWPFIGNAHMVLSVKDSTGKILFFVLDSLNHFHVHFKMFSASAWNGVRSTAMLRDAFWVTKCSFF